MHRSLVCLTVGLSLVSIGAARAEAGTWSAPEQVTGAGFGGTAAIGPDGTAVVMWDPQHPGEFGGRGLRLAVRFGDGTYGPHQDVPTDDAADDELMWPAWGRLAVGADGRADVVWRTGTTVQVATTGTDGVLGPPRVLVADARYPSFDIAASASETIVTFAGGHDATPQHVVRAAGAAVYGAPQRAPGVALSMAADGTATVLTTSAQRLAVAHRPVGGTFGDPVVASADPPSEWTSVQDVVGGRDGSLAVLLHGWVRDETGAWRQGRWVQSAGPDGRLGPAAAIDHGVATEPECAVHADSYSSHALAVRAGGLAIVATERRAWRKDPQVLDPNGNPACTGVADGLQVQDVSPEGTATEEAQLRDVPVAHVARIGVDSAGAAIVVAGTGRDTRAVTIPEAGAPCPAVVVAAHDSVPSLLALDGDVGIMAWQPIPSSQVQLALHRPTLGCPASPTAVPAPAPPVAESGSAAPDPEVFPGPLARAQAPGGAAPAGGAAEPAPTPDLTPVPSAATVDPVAAARPRGRLARLTMRCSAGALPCRGQLALVLARATGVRARVGAARYALAPGTRAQIAVRLTPAARRALRRSQTRRLETRVNVTPAGGPGRSTHVTIRVR